MYLFNYSKNANIHYNIVDVLPVTNILESSLKHEIDVSLSAAFAVIPVKVVLVLSSCHDAIDEV